MSESKSRHIERTQAGVAKFFRVSPGTVKDWVSRGMPGTTGNYDLSEIDYWLWTAGPRRPKPRLDDDPLLAADVDSPGLERYRVAKAVIAELDAAERRGELIEVDRAQDIFSRLAGHLRQCGDELQRDHGPKVANVFNEALTEFESVINDELSSPEPAGGPPA